MSVSRPQNVLFRCSLHKGLSYRCQQAVTTITQIVECCLPKQTTLWDKLRSKNQLFQTKELPPAPYTPCQHESCHASAVWKNCRRKTRWGPFLQVFIKHEKKWFMHEGTPPGLPPYPSPISSSFSLPSPCNTLGHEATHLKFVLPASIFPTPVEYVRQAQHEVSTCTSIFWGTLFNRCSHLKSEREPSPHKQLYPRVISIPATPSP